MLTQPTVIPVECKIEKAVYEAIRVGRRSGGLTDNGIARIHGLVPDTSPRVRAVGPPKRAYLDEFVVMVLSLVFLR